MPVKRPIRRRKSSLLKQFSWTSKPAGDAWRVMRTRVATFWNRSIWNRAAWNRTVKRLTHVTVSIDRSTGAALLFCGSMILAMAIVGYRMPSGVAGTDESTIATQHDDSTAASPTTAPTPAKVRAARSTHAVDSASEASVQTTQMVTIAGCLAQDGETFRLRDTSGADAPRSRSWKSAFLRKSPASVGIVDPSHRLRLTSHIGERVSVTGTLLDGEMQVRSLRRVSSSCGDDKPKVNA